MEAFSYVAVGALLFLFALYWVIRLAIIGAAEEVGRRRAKHDQQPQQPQQHP